MALALKDVAKSEHFSTAAAEDTHNIDTTDDFDPFHGIVECIDEDVDSLTAPPENQWYHGRLGRTSAEQRLCNAGNPGEGYYLVRESDRKAGSYVLSFLGKEGPKHFRITAVCGAYYIGGREFNSLSDLIGYYTTWSDLLENERLLNPTPPPEPVHHERKVKAILPYNQVPDTDELSFEKGEVFIVHNDMGDGWLWATSQTSGLSGIVNQALMQDAEDGDMDPVTTSEWYWDSITKEYAADLLGNSGPGSFLVRPSDSNPTNFTLFFYPQIDKEAIRRFNIIKKDQQYSIGNRYFESVSDIIERYKREEILAGCTLQKPVTKIANRLGDPAIKRNIDVYPTIKPSSGSNFFLQKKDYIVMNGWLDKKSQKTKKWKKMYFVLNGSEQHVFFFENEKRSKPKGLIDLSISSLYPVHNSFFGRPNCFQLIVTTINQVQVNYICAETADIAQEWIQKLKPYCMNTQSKFIKQPVHPTPTSLRSLVITLHDAKKLSTKYVPNPYCIVSLKDVKVCRTTVKTAPDPCWDEDFHLDDIPPDVDVISVNVFNKGKRTSKDTNVLSVRLPLSDLTPGKTLDQWLVLTPTNPTSKSETASLRAKIRYLHEIIMPLDDYKGLKEVICAKDLNAVWVLNELCYDDRVTLAPALLQTFRSERQEHILLCQVMIHEIKREESPSQLFRGNSLATTLMDHYMKMTCLPFVQSAVQNTVSKILELKQPLEIHLGNENCAEIEASYKALRGLLHEALALIFHSTSHCPEVLRYICHEMQEAVKLRWPEDSQVKSRVVSGFIFLRLLCPAILNPKQYNLMTEAPSTAAAKTLKTVTNCLMKLANLTESYAEPVNDFLVENKPKMITFLDQLSNVHECPQLPEVPKVDRARALATLHQLCSTHLNELSQLTDNNKGFDKFTVKNLVTVTGLLNSHKNHYKSVQI